MKTRNLDLLEDILQKRGIYYDNVKTPIIYYYLSRKLKSNKIEEIIDLFGDKYFKDQIHEIYESNYESIMEIQKIDDLTKEEVTLFLNSISNKFGFRNGELTTPMSIIDIALSILDIEENDKFLDIGSGVGTTILSATQFTKNIHGIDINRDNIFISQLLLDLFEISGKNVVLADALIYDNCEFEANKIFINTPLSLRISRDRFNNILDVKFKESKYKNIMRTTDISWIFALDIIENCKFDKLAMIFTASSLSNMRDAEIRKQLMLDKKIESIIELPVNLIFNTTIPVYVVVFSNNNELVRLVNAENLYTEKGYNRFLEKSHIREILNGLESDTKISMTISYEQAKKEDFTLLPRVHESREFLFDKYIKLKDVVHSINRGAILRKSVLDELITEEPTQFQYLTLQNFQDGIIDEKLDYLKDLDEKMNKFFIKDNSLIISKMSPFKIGVVDKISNNLLANGNLYFVEVNEELIDKDFLAAYLQSKEGLKELSRYEKGGVMKTISISDLEKVKIPDITRDKQQAIGKEFALLNAELKAVKQRHEQILKNKINIIKEAS